MKCIEEYDVEFGRIFSEICKLVDFENIKKSDFHKNIFNKKLVNLFLCNLSPFTNPPNGIFSLLKNHLQTNDESKCFFYPICFRTFISSVMVKDGISTVMVTGKEKIEDKLKFFELDIEELSSSLSDFTEIDDQLLPENNDGYVFFSEKGNWIVINSSIMNFSFMAFFDATWKEKQQVVDLLKNEALESDSLDYHVKFALEEASVNEFYGNYLLIIEKSLRDLNV